MHSKLAPERARDHGAARIDESAWVSKGIWRPDVVVVIVTVVSAVGKVESLSDELQRNSLAQSDVFRQPQIELEEGIAVKRVIACNRACLRNPMQAVKTVLRAGIVA